MARDNLERSAAIQGFVERLSQVREDAGRPSFREMAKRSGAISHATMHDALQGARMPSWETTVEFAKACDSDPDDLRAAWEEAIAVVRRSCAEAIAADPEAAQGACDEVTPSPESVLREVEGSSAAGPPAPVPAAPAPPAPAAPPSTDPPSRGPVVSRAVAAVAVGIAALLAVVLLTREAPESQASSFASETGEAAAAYENAPGAPSTTTSAQGCPENAKVAPGTTTLVAGDRSEFVRDVTVADCSTQPRGQSVVKTWELKNTGTVEWTGRFLHRINMREGDRACRAPDRVAIPDTDPGESVQVSVTVATPDRRATCFGRWMQTDEAGSFTFPEQRPYYYTFKVE